MTKPENIIEVEFRNFISQLKFDAHGLIPAIIQDHVNNEVLMLGYMNREALLKTLAGPHVVFYSRSRRSLWLKGETSGHKQMAKEILFDCDADTLLVKVEQNVAACHEGYRSCFFTRWEKGVGKIIAKKIV